MYVITPLVSTKRNFPPQLLASHRTNRHRGCGRSCLTEIFWGQLDIRHLLAVAFFGEPGVHRPHAFWPKVLGADPETKTPIVHSA